MTDVEKWNRMPRIMSLAAPLAPFWGKNRHQDKKEATDMSKEDFDALHAATERSLKAQDMTDSAREKAESLLRAVRILVDAGELTPDAGTQVIKDLIVAVFFNLKSDHVEAV